MSTWKSKKTRYIECLLKFKYLILVNYRSLCSILYLEGIGKIKIHRTFDNFLIFRIYSEIIAGSFSRFLSAVDITDRFWCTYMYTYLVGRVVISPGLIFKIDISPDGRVREIGPLCANARINVREEASLPLYTVTLEELVTYRQVRYSGVQLSVHVASIIDDRHRLFLCLRFLPLTTLPFFSRPSGKRAEKRNL